MEPKNSALTSQQVSFDLHPNPDKFVVPLHSCYTRSLQLHEQTEHAAVLHWKCMTLDADVRSCRIQEQSYVRRIQQLGEP